ncbi:hypothetical protein [Streptomyces nojiriensis]|uniref:hypothetical protein n=1 Tax=Streptomyces nojiriensis TaxID=66374 RepID=UPI00365BD3A6
MRTYRSTAASVEAMPEDVHTLVQVESPSRDLGALNASARAVAAAIRDSRGAREHDL